jgi:uncharacterized protein (TIGR02246 family)
VEASDHAGILRLLASYCQYLDNADLDRLVELWAEDGEFCAVGSTSAGRPAIRKFLEPFMEGERAGGTKHLTMNSVIDVTGDTAMGVSDFLVIQRREDRVVTSRVGQYHDEYVRAAGEWRFKSRTNVSSAWHPPDGSTDFGDWAPETRS